MSSKILFRFKTHSIELNKRLDHDSIIPFAGSDFYRIGLSLFRPQPIKRQIFFHPLLVLLIVASYTFKTSIVMTILQAKDRILALIFGQWLFFMPGEIQTHMAISFLLFCSNGLIFPIIHHKYYYFQKEPIYLKPFHMMAGSVTPLSIGLNNVNDVQKIIRRTKIYLKCSDLLIKSGIPSAIISSAIPLGLNANLIEFIVLVIPHVIFYVCSVYYTSCILVFQIVYFYIY